MLARDFDPLIYYEDLSGDAVKSVVEVFNREVEELVGGLARIHCERLLDYLKNPRVTSATLIKDGVVAIYRGLRDEVVLLKDGRRITLHSSSDAIPSSVERVEGSDSLVAINYSIMGADESRVYIVDVSGKPLYVLEGVVSDFAIKEGALYYVRSYRDVKPPDGGGTPTDRVVKLVNGEEKVIWGGGFVGDGESIGIVYSPDLRRALVSVYRGWSRSRLYLVDLDSGSSELLEGGDYNVIPAGWGKDYVYIRRKAEGMEVVVGGRAFKVDRPIDNAIATGDKLLLVENVSASHRVKVYNLESMEFQSP